MLYNHNFFDSLFTMYLGFLDTTSNEIIKLIAKNDDNIHANSSMDAIVYSSLFCVFFKDFLSNLSFCQQIYKCK